MSESYDIKQAAAFLKICEQTMQELAASGEVPGAKVGKAWVFLQDDLVDWLRGTIKTQQAQRKNAEAVDSRLKSALNRAERRTRRRLPTLPEPGSEVARAQVGVPS